MEELETITTTSSEFTRDSSRIEELEALADEKGLTPEQKDELAHLRNLRIRGKRPRTQPAEREITLANPTRLLDLDINSDVHGLMSHEQKLAFEAKLALDVSWMSRDEILSRICWFYANNGASEQISSDIVILKSKAPNQRAMTVGQLSLIMTAVDASLTIRRVLRSYADFTRSLLLSNPNLMTKMYRRHNMPEHLRHVAFDYAEFCSDPPLTPLERRQVQEARSLILTGQRLQSPIGVRSPVSSSTFSD